MACENDAKTKPPNSLPESKLERYFAAHEFSTPLLACCSDVEPLTVEKLLDLVGRHCDCSTKPSTSTSKPSTSSKSSSSSSFFDSVSLGYVDPRGGPLLRDAVAREHGGGGGGIRVDDDDESTITADDVVVAAPQELAYLLQRSLLQRGDAVVAPWPVYPGLVAVAEAVGASVVSWFPRWEEQEQEQEDEQEDEAGEGGRSKNTRPRFDVDVDLRRALDRASSLAAAAASASASAFASAAEEQKDDGSKSSRRPPALRLIVLNFPHNPTGVSLPRGDFELALRMSAATGAHVLSDEMYRGVEGVLGGKGGKGKGGGGEEESTPTMLPTAAALSLSLFRPSSSSSSSSISTTKKNKIVSLGGLSKWGGCPGLRIGWLVTKDRALLEALSSLRDHTSICNSALSEAAAAAALSSSCCSSPREEGDEREGTTTTVTSRNCSCGGSAEILRRRARAIVARNLEAAAAFFSSSPSSSSHGDGNGGGDDKGDKSGFGDLVDFYAPEASPVCLPRIRTELLDGTSTSSADEFCARAREEAGVLLLPASAFFGGGVGGGAGAGGRGSGGGGSDDEGAAAAAATSTMGGRFRLGLGRENLPEALEALRPLLERMRRDRAQKKRKEQQA